MDRIGMKQKYRGYLIRRTHAGYAIERPNGAFVCTLGTYAACRDAIDAWCKIAAWGGAVLEAGPL